MKSMKGKILRKKKVFFISASNGRSLQHSNPSSEIFEQVDFYNYSRGGMAITEIENVFTNIGFSENFLYIIFLGWNRIENFYDYPIKFLSALMGLLMKGFKPDNIIVMGALPKGKNYNDHQLQMNCVNKLLKELDILGFKTFNSYQNLPSHLKRIPNLFGRTSQTDGTFVHYGTDVRHFLHNSIAKIIGEYYKFRIRLVHKNHSLIPSLMDLQFERSRKNTRLHPYN